MSQRLRILRIVALILVPVVAVVVFAIWREVQDGEAQVARDRVALARAAALATQAFIDGNLSTVRTMARAPAIVQLNANAPRFLAEGAAVKPEWEGVAVVGAGGVVLASSGQGSVNISDRSYFQQVMATRQPVVSSGIIGRTSGLPTIVLAVPIDFASGEQGAIIVPLPT